MWCDEHGDYRTDYPPPPGFDQNLADGRYGDDDYARYLTPEEEDLVVDALPDEEANAEDDIDPVMHEQRDAFFEGLRRKIEARVKDEDADAEENEEADEEPAFEHVADLDDRPENAGRTANGDMGTGILGCGPDVGTSSAETSEAGTRCTIGAGLEKQARHSFPAAPATTSAPPARSETHSLNPSPQRTLGSQGVSTADSAVPLRSQLSLG